MVYLVNGVTWNSVWHKMSSLSFFAMMWYLPDNVRLLVSFGFCYSWFWLLGLFCIRQMENQKYSTTLERILKQQLEKEIPSVQLRSYLSRRYSRGIENFGPKNKQAILCLKILCWYNCRKIACFFFFGPVLLFSPRNVEYFDLYLSFHNSYLLFLVCVKYMLSTFFGPFSLLPIHYKLIRALWLKSFPYVENKSTINWFMWLAAWNLIVLSDLDTYWGLVFAY